MRSTVIASLACLCVALSAVKADLHSQDHVSDVSGHAVQHSSHSQHQQQPLQYQQQQHQQHQSAGQKPYPLRRQSTLERARNQMMGFFRNIMNAGSRLRRMASERISTMLTRRSFRSSGRRQDRPQYVRQPQ